MIYDIAVKHHLTPVGCLTIFANQDGVTRIEFGKLGQETACSPILRQTCQELDEYFAGDRREFSVPLSITGTPFQKTVWSALMRIPYGAIPSYSDIADDIGNAGAVRAVGMANNKNPVPIIIPCHRVIGRDGSLTGYAGGIEIKQWLLDLELSPEACEAYESGFVFSRPATLHVLQ